MSRLPMAWLAGVRVKSINAAVCETTVPFKYLTKNPFRSTYFACLAMAAELSTGVFAFIGMRAAPKPVSMLVVSMEAEYMKKATGITRFVCEDGEAISACVTRTCETGEAEVFKAKSTGYNAANEVVAVMHFTWSVKRKS